jgi:peptidyl-prolyl cis-trans isomerase A (cyclophilin A)
LGLGFIALIPLSASAQTNGIFADFTTSMGSFTCQLSYSNSPTAVANFVGLATGGRAWEDSVTGQARTNAFYDGLTFHRVIAGFVIQAGSQDATGGDGPGYAFKDEFNPSLTFGAPWVLAMANSGPDSNGSQFFITVAPFTSGNNKYVVFGRVVSGTNTVNAINHVATDANDKPRTNVVIQQVIIRREGAAAQAFDINSHGLPVVSNQPLKAEAVNGQLSLTFSNKLYADNRWYSSTNLSSWILNSSLEIDAPVSNTVPIAIDAPHKFFRLRLTQVQYAATTLAPKNLLGRTLVLAFAAGLGTNTTIFDHAGGGTYKMPGTGPGTVESYTWSQEPYRGLLLIQYSGLVELSLNLHFNSLKSGSFTGTAYTLFPFSVSGTFTLSDP